MQKKYPLVSLTSAVYRLACLIFIFQLPHSNIVLTKIFLGRLVLLRRFHNEEFHSLYCSPNVGRVIKSKILTRMEEGRNALKI